MLIFKAAVPCTIIVKFSDTGTSASDVAVPRYLIVNTEQTESWTSRENNGAEAPYAAQLNVTTGAIAVPAGEVTIIGTFAIQTALVTFVPEKQDEPVVEGPKTCAEAAETALSVAANNAFYNDGAEYTIEGYVTAIQTAFNATNKNITFWMADTEDGGQALEAYRAVCETAEAAPAVGDKVTVTGKLTKYNKTPEFAEGCTFVIKEKSAPAQNLGEKTIAEFLALKNIKDTCVLTGVVDSIVSPLYGNLFLVDETDTLYVYGVLTLTQKAGNYEFGMKFDGTWKANGAELTREATSTSLAEGNGNMKLTAREERSFLQRTRYRGRITPKLMARLALTCLCDLSIQTILVQRSFVVFNS